MTCMSMIWLLVEKTLGQLATLKDTAIVIFHEAGFKVCKWHWNVIAIEGKELLK